MTDTELIANQTREIGKLRIELSECKSHCRAALGYLICIGGPLNDNRDQYSKKQMIPLFKIEERLRLVG